jgi:hypothetical protein
MCLATAPNTGINILEQLYESLIESRMMTGVEIWGLDDGWREIGNAHEMFCKRIMEAPTAAASGACVKELGRTSRKEKVLERLFKYWERLLEMEESSLLGDALTYQREKRENNWI